MRKNLYLLSIFVLFTVVPLRAQTGNALVPAGKSLAAGVRATSRLPAAGQATLVSTEKVTHSAANAQRGAKAAADMAAGHPHTSVGSAPSANTFNPGNGNSALNTARIQPPSSMPKIDFPAQAAPNFRPAQWAQDLITPDTPVQIATTLKLLATHWNHIRVSKSKFTEEQLARVDEAEKYFLSLTPEQANDINVISSAEFRGNAMVLRSPTATQYGYFFTGYRLQEEYMNRVPNESGYIPVYIGEPKNGFGRWDMRSLIPSPNKTNRPIFVQLDIHGGINSLERFHAGINISRTISTEEIVRAMQDLRQLTGAPEVNLFVDSCCTGGFLDEFEALPLSQRQGINVFVPTGAGQCTALSATVHYRTHTPGNDIAKDLVEKMIRQIIEGHIMP
ncbi:MAG: hypothetical protein IKP06_05710 [Elusimicrobiaceae bacterium]|nr:hypothetical protein [Elusimicrobiaceae bacterium]